MTDFINGNEPARVMEILNTQLSAGRSKHVWGGAWEAAFEAIRRRMRDFFDRERFARFRVFDRDAWNCALLVYYPRPGEVAMTTRYLGQRLGGIRYGHIVLDVDDPPVL